LFLLLATLLAGVGFFLRRSGLADRRFAPGRRFGFHSL
jgi:hypothetical protein